MVCSPFVAIVSAAENIRLVCGHWTMTLIRRNTAQPADQTRSIVNLCLPETQIVRISWAKTFLFKVGIPLCDRLITVQIYVNTRTFIFYYFEQWQINTQLVN
jgi:hypothetical protein